MRRASLLRIASIALITGSVVVFADVAITLAWKEPLSSLYASISQGDARKDVDAFDASFPSAVGPDQEALRRDAAKLADRFEPELDRGNGIGLISLPAIDSESVLVQGEDLDTLAKGPGHYSQTALPGQGDTVAIAGHRTIYDAPFRHIDELEEGDLVIVEMPYADFTYSVDRTRIVEPDELEVVQPVGHEQVVLTACHPLHSAAERIVVSADLAAVSEKPPTTS